MIPSNIPSLRSILADPAHNPQQFKLPSELQAQDVEDFVDNFANDWPKIKHFREETSEVKNLDAQLRLITKINSMMAFHSWELKRIFPNRNTSPLVQRLAHISSQIQEEKAALVNKIFAALHCQQLGDLFSPERLCTGTSILHLAARDGQRELATALIREGVAIDTPNDSGVTPLMLACLNSHFEIAEALLAAGANINAQNQHGQTALAGAALAQRSEVVTFLLTHNANPNIADGRHHSPLWNLFSKGPCDVVKKNIALALIQHGAATDIQLPNGNFLVNTAMWLGWDALMAAVVSHTEMNAAWLNHQNEDGYTPLGEAVEAKCFALASSFVDKGANCTTRNHFGTSPLEAAFRENVPALILKMLGQSPNCNFLIGHPGVPPLIYAINHAWDFDGSAYHLNPTWEQVIDRLLALGVDIRAKDSLGRTALHAACAENLQTLAMKLVELGVDSTIKDSAGMTPIHSLAIGGMCYTPSPKELIQLLMQKGVNINAKNHYGRTALNLLPHNNVVEALLALGADVNIPDSDGKTPLYYAIEHNSSDLILLLCEHNAHLNVTNTDDSNLLHVAAEHGCENIIQKILRKKFASKEYLNRQNKKLETALLLACKNKQTHVACILLGAGVDVNIPDATDKTALYYAIENKDFTAMYALIAHGARLDVTDKSGTTLLHLAVQKGLEKLIKKQFLTQKFASVPYINQQNENLETSLSLACKNNYSRIAIALLGHGARVDVQDKDGITPLAWAFQNQNPSLILKMLDTNPNLSTEKMPLLLTAYDSKRRCNITPAAEKWKAVIDKLCEKKVSLQCCDEEGRTLLHTTCSAGAYSDALAFIEMGCSPTAKTKNGKTALMLLVEEAPSLSPQLSTLIKKLIEKGTPIDARDGNGKTAFFTACERGKQDIAKLLLAAHANPHLAPPKATSPIFSIIEHNWLDLFEECIAQKIPLSVRNADGGTILHTALALDRAQFLKFLFQQNQIHIDIFAKNSHDDFYRSPLYHKNQRIDCLEAIFSGPCDLGGKGLNEFLISLDQNPLPLLGYSRSPLEIAFLLCRALPIQAMLARGLYTKETLERDFEALAKKYTFCAPGGLCPMTVVDQFRIACLFVSNPDHLERLLPRIAGRPPNSDPMALLALFRSLNTTDPTKTKSYIAPSSFGLIDQKDGEKKLGEFLASLDHNAPKFDEIEAGLCHIEKALENPAIDKKVVFTHLFSLTAMPMPKLYWAILNLYTKIRLALLPKDVDIHSLQKIFHDLPTAEKDMARKKGQEAQLTEFIETITEKRLNGLNPNEPKALETYRDIEAILGHIAGAIKTGDAEQEEVFAELFKFNSSNICGPALYAELTEFYYKTVRKVPITFENMILLSLENFRRSLLKSFIQEKFPNNMQTRHDYTAIVQAYPKLGLPEFIELGQFDDLYKPHVNPLIYQQIVKKWGHHYAPLEMIHWIVPEFLQKENTRNRFIDFMKTQVPPSFHSELPQDERERAFLEEFVYTERGKFNFHALLDMLMTVGVIQSLKFAQAV
jgi:hypothetical protein